MTDKHARVLIAYAGREKGPRCGELFVKSRHFLFFPKTERGNSVDFVLIATLPVIYLFVVVVFFLVSGLFHAYK